MQDRTNTGMAMHWLRVSFVGWVTVALAACSTVGPRTCLPGQDAAVQELIYFGVEKPSGGRVTAEEWTRFLGEVVTPRFPKGFTTWDASGQWQSEAGGIVREPSHVLSVVHPAGADAAAVGEVVEAYKTEFGQEAVLRVTSNVCMAL